MKDLLGRVCKKCAEYKTWENFSKKNQKGRLSDYQPKCKPCASKDTQDWYAANKERAKDTRLKTSYGIGLEEYKAKVLALENRCPICEKEFSILFGPDSPVVDHCHTKGHVRGVICNECNRGLGYFRDNISALRKAADYLEEI